MKAGARKKTVARKKTAAAKAAAAIREKKKAEKEKQVDDEEEAEDEQRKAEDDEEEKTAAAGRKKQVDDEEEAEDGPLVISNIAILDPSCQDHVWECLEGNKKVACIVCSYKHDLGKRKGLPWYRNKRPFNAGQFCRKCCRPEFNFYFVACNRVREGECRTCQSIAHSFNTLY